jgi:hypothetical protein
MRRRQRSGRLRRSDGLVAPKNKKLFFLIYATKTNNKVMILGCSTPAWTKNQRVSSANGSKKQKTAVRTKPKCGQQTRRGRALSKGPALMAGQ